MKIPFAFILTLLSSTTFSQHFDHVEPPFWFVGMKNDTLEILFHNDQLDVGTFAAEIQHPGVELLEVKSVENPHYLFVKMKIGSLAQPGILPIKFSSGKKSFVHRYELRERSSASNRNQGFNSSDVIYLIMPDRFANGDPSNDNVKGMHEQADRKNPEGRHGGDLAGITNNLSYIKDLGVTTVWLTPVLENNQKRTSYHGYSITDLYNVDARSGGNTAYLKFVEAAHKEGVKVVKDMVMNHLGSEHWLVLDLPEKDWIHQFPSFTRTNYQGHVPSDPYSASADQTALTDGWFDISMPDLNQKNKRFARYLIQNTLWWIEYSGIDGIRMDTYPYPDKDFMSDWARAVKEEFPRFNIVGEVWLNNSVAGTAYWQDGKDNSDGYRSNLPSVTDFPFCFTVAQALNEPSGFETGLRRLYLLLSQDFIYPRASHNVTFLDNHDMSRFFLSVGRDLEKFKMGVAFLLTTRGIPALYYGTELLMDGDGNSHPNVRKDFPGGWTGDPVNAFTQGRTPQQAEAFEYLKKLLTWRQRTPVIHSGELTHYIPQDNIYVYFRSNANERVMVIMNGNANEVELPLNRFQDMLKGYNSCVNVMTDQKMIFPPRLKIAQKSALILELRK